MMTDIPTLLQRMKDGDEAALAALFNEYSAKVYGMAYTVLKNTSLAQEVAQDTFVRVWKDPAAWDPSKGQFSSWLLTVARYTAIDRLRHELRRTHQNVELNDELTSDEADDETTLLFETYQLKTVLHHLPDEQRHIIELAYFHGLKHSELAESLQLPLGTVKTRLRLGLQKLRSLLQSNP